MEAWAAVMQAQGHIDKLISGTPPLLIWLGVLAVSYAILGIVAYVGYCVLYFLIGALL